MTGNKVVYEPWPGAFDDILGTAEIERLRAALERISTPEAFFIATGRVDAEVFARMVYAKYILEGHTLRSASDKAEKETIERYMPKA